MSQAVARILGNSGEVAHELLELGVDFLKFAPAVGLDMVARALLDVWDALQLVNVSLSALFPMASADTEPTSPQINRAACLRLTERCAIILISVCDEVEGAGIEVATKLQTPLTRLIE